MRSLIIAVVCLTVLSAFSSVVSAEPRAFFIEAVFYRVHGDIVEVKLHRARGKVSLPGRIGSRLFRKRTQSKKEAFVLFERAELTVADVELKADERGWTWDGENSPPNDGRIELIADPRILSPAGESFAFEIRSERPIQYLEKRPDGLFEMKSSLVPLGLSVRATVEEGKSGHITVRNWKISANLALTRRPIKGVTLDVGPPIIHAEQYETTVTVKPGRYYGLLLSAERQGGLIVRLRVDPQDET
jgi:hypothetical protein